MNKNISEYGKDTQFSKDNQPPAENKRVPKWKTRFKKILEDEESLKAFEKEIKSGNIRAWALMFERVHGKVTDKIKHSGSIETTDITGVISEIKKALKK